jgi:hypothetical protein
MVERDVERNQGVRMIFFHTMQGQGAGHGISKNWFQPLEPFELFQRALHFLLFPETAETVGTVGTIVMLTMFIRHTCFTVVNDVS